MESDVKFERSVMKLISNLVAPQYRNAPLGRGAHLSFDLGLDSISVLSLLFSFEREFGIELTNVDLGDDIGQLRTVGDALDIGKKLLQQARRNGAETGR